MIRPRRSTPVASNVMVAACDMPSVIQCWRCQSVGAPSSAEYWHIGATAMRLRTVMPPRANGENNADVIGESGEGRGRV